MLAHFVLCGGVQALLQLGQSGLMRNISLLRKALERSRDRCIKIMFGMVLFSHHRQMGRFGTSLGGVDLSAGQ
jgi:hypothetical protein